MTTTETKTYNVYLHREIGVKFLDIEADSPEDAASTARGMATGFADRIDDHEDLSASVDLAESGRSQPAVTLNFAAGRLRQAAPSQAMIIDLVQQGLMTLQEGEAEFDGVMYWFDHRQPDWCVGVLDAIGWDTARDGITQATTGERNPL